MYDEHLLPTSTPRRSRWLYFLALVALVAGLGAGLYGYLAWKADKDLAEVVASIDRADPHWRLDDLEAHRKPFPDEQNGALVVLKAKSLKPPNWPAWMSAKEGEDQDIPEGYKFEESLGDLPHNVRLNERQARILRREVARAAEAVAEARKLADLRGGRFAITYSRDLISTLLPHVQEARELANLLKYDATLRAEDGDLDGAVLSLRAMLVNSRVIGDEPTLISQLVRVACRAITTGSIRRVLAQGEPPPEALAQLQQALEEDDKENLFLHGMRGERAFFNAMLERLESGELSLWKMLQGISGRNILFGGGPTFDEIRLLISAGSLKYNHSEGLRILTEAVADAQLPPEVQLEKFKTFKDKCVAAPILPRLLLPAVEKVGEATRRGNADLRCCYVALAVERFRQANGRWPESLAELTPRYLTEVPTDPYDGKPLRYKKTLEGVVIYSINVDLEDNGGNVPQGYKMEKGVDWGVRLYSKELRRQPQPEKPPKPVEAEQPQP